MKKIFAFLTLTLLFSSSYAQDYDSYEDRKVNVGVDIYNDFWLEAPDFLDAQNVNMGYNIYGMYNYRLKKGRYSMAAGLGISTHNIASNTIIEDIKADNINLSLIPADIDYKKSKISFSYFDIPFEIRYKSPKQFRIAAGMKIGIYMDSHSKYKGERLNNSGVQEKVKEKSIGQLNKYLYGGTLRIGYKWINIYTFYALNTIFKEFKGPEFFPLSVGITFMPY